jgi:hypothetical protein
MYLQTKNTNFGEFLNALQWKNFSTYMIRPFGILRPYIRCILRPFGKFCGHFSILVSYTMKHLATHFGVFLNALQWNIFGHDTAFWYFKTIGVHILRPFGKFCGHFSILVSYTKKHLATLC